MKNVGKTILEGVLALALVAALLFVTPLALIWASFAFGADTDVKEPWEQVIERELNIEIEGGVEEEYIETHGGFLGDGLTYIRVDFSGAEFESVIEGNSAWKETPLTENIHTALHGDETWQGIKYSYDFLLPEVENGYYYFLDRQSDSFDDTDLLNRVSFNFTFALYDLEETKLYYLEFDT